MFKKSLMGLVIKGRLFLNVCAVAFSLLILTGIGHAAQLDFSLPLVERHPGPSETQVVASFPFVNNSGFPITILSTMTSCGCTTVQLDKLTYQQSERGTIEVTFAIGDRVGVQAKIIQVNTISSKEQGKTELTKLTIRAFLPSGPSLSTAFADWRVGSALSSKVVNITIPDDSPYRILSAHSENENFIVTVKPGLNKNTYEMTVTPADASRPMNGLIKIISDPPRTWHAYTRIVPENTP